MHMVSRTSVSSRRPVMRVLPFARPTHRLHSRHEQFIDQTTPGRARRVVCKMEPFLCVVGLFSIICGTRGSHSAHEQYGFVPFEVGACDPSCALWGFSLSYCGTWSSRSAREQYGFVPFGRGASDKGQICALMSHGAGNMLGTSKGPSWVAPRTGLSRPRARSLEPLP